MPNKTPKNDPGKKKILLQAPKGMHDILSEEYVYYKNIYEKAESVADYYGFSPIKTPHLERMEIFTAGLGETSDVVEKQMYNLKTRGGDRLTLRPEGTAPIVRAFLEHGMHTLPQPVMLQYSGSFFRHEKPQKGRFREFEQFGLEIINEEKPIAEAMVIKILVLILEEIGLKNIIVRINSLGDKECRNNYRKELLSYYRKKLNVLCRDCKQRFNKNPLRILDCKEQSCIETKKEAPQMIDFLCESCKHHFKEVLEFLDSNNVPYFLDTHLVRGLDYYTRTVFEIFEENTETNHGQEKAAEPPLALGSGGRYDYLAKTLSGKNFPGIGGALGIDRITQIMSARGMAPRDKKNAKIFFIQLGNAAKHKSFGIIETFRKARIPLAQSVSKDSLKSQIKIASKLNIPFSLIMGQKEALENSVILRHTDSGIQETAPLEKIVEIVKNKLKAQQHYD